MGQTLSEPITSKETKALQNAKVKVGSSTMQGWRISMEDAHTHILKAVEDPEAMFFGVYDGHGGAKIAQYVSNNLHKHIFKHSDYKSGNYASGMQKGFLECDATMRVEESLKDEMSGSTAITALIRGDRLYVANAGDSRAICGINGVGEALSVDHKPSDEKERKRIEEAGGFVEFNRVNGNLALSRALGDFAFKNSDHLPAEDQIVSGCPEVVERKITPDWDFLLLACDGIWDVLSNQEVTDFVLRRISQGLEPEEVCEELMTRCLATDCTMGGLGCDNMTVILVCFLHGQPYKRLIDKCVELMKKKDQNRKKQADKDNEDEENGDHESDKKHKSQSDKKSSSDSSKISKLDSGKKGGEAK